MKCPICSKDNNCFSENDRDPNKCWCHNVEFPKNLPDYGICICLECATKLKKEELRDDIINLERTFQLDTVKNGAKGWSKYFAEDGMMITSEHNENIIGKKAIEAYMHPVLSDSSFILEWEPNHIEFSDDYTICYSSGMYTRTHGVNVSTGKFLTIWSRTTLGWEIKLDIGN